MMKNKSGKIVNVASNNGIESFFPTSIDYDASKGAMVSLTKNLAIQFAPYINVNAVAPGRIDTDMNKHLSQEIIQSETANICLKRM
jgi:3-oxoacyl-[acyl-carrier protein] reductase